MFLSGRHEPLTGVAGRGAEQLDRAWCRGRDELLELAVKRGDLAIEGFDPLRERAQRELRGLGRRAKPAAERRSKSRVDRRLGRFDDLIGFRIRCHEPKSGSVRHKG